MAKPKRVSGIEAEDLPGVNIIVKMHPDFIAKLNQIASDRWMSRSELIREALRQHFWEQLNDKK